MCLSADGLQAATCSSDGVKIWSTRQHSCLRTCATGYGVSVAFAPGGRYVITGTKDGKLQVRDGLKRMLQELTNFVFCILYSVDILSLFSLKQSIANFKLVVA